jgi:hypothetical protein
MPSGRTDARRLVLLAEAAATASHVHDGENAEHGERYESGHIHRSFSFVNADVV